jgi:hypothetical protein
MITADTLVTLAKQVESEDPIDWGMLSINEDDAYRLIATSVLEQFSEPWNIDQQTGMLATITKLIVENMTLNLKLMQRNE